MGLEVEVVGETNKFDVIVIGGGVAGMTASCVVTQMGLKSCFLERDVPGGKLMQLETIHNFPPAEGVSGPDLARSLLNQATEQVKTNYVFGNVQSIRPKNDLFYLFTEDGQTWEAKAIIFCTGTINKKLNVPGEEQYFNKGLSYCVLCDASLVKNQKVVLIGNTSHLNTLKQYTNDVITLDANEVKEIIGDGNKLTGLLTNDGKKIVCDYVFVENGYDYVTDFIPSEIRLSENKEIIVDINQATNFPGAYAAGDCTNSKVKMIMPAMQQANTAASNAVNYINQKHW